MGIERVLAGVATRQNARSCLIASLTRSSVSPAAARFSAESRGLSRLQLRLRVQNRNGKGAGYSPRERRAEFRENDGGVEGAGKRRLVEVCNRSGDHG